MTAVATTRGVPDSRPSRGTGASRFPRAGLLKFDFASTAGSASVFLRTSGARRGNRNGGPGSALVDDFF